MENYGEVSRLNIKAQHQLNARQVVRDEIQQNLSKLQASRTAKGENDPKVQLILEKFKSGKKLTPDELAYVRRNAPGMIDNIEQIAREREIVEQGMRMAPTKMDVQIVVYQASQHISNNKSSEELSVRAMQLADAHREYMQTKEYEDKPNSPLDHRDIVDHPFS